MLTSAAVGQLEDDELSLLLPWHGPVFRHGHVTGFFAVRLFTRLLTTTAAWSTFLHVIIVTPLLPP